MQTSGYATISNPSQGINKTHTKRLIVMFLRCQEEDVIKKLILVKSESLKDEVVAKQTKQQDFEVEVKQ